MSAPRAIDRGLVRGREDKAAALSHLAELLSRRPDAVAFVRATARACAARRRVVVEVPDGLGPDAERIMQHLQVLLDMPRGFLTSEPGEDWLDEAATLKAFRQEQEQATEGAKL